MPFNCSEKEVEERLRRECRLSRSQAKTLIAAAKAQEAKEEGDEAGVQLLAETFNRLAFRI